MATIKPAVMAFWDRLGGLLDAEEALRRARIVAAKKSMRKKRAAGSLGGRPKSLKITIRQMHQVLKTQSRTKANQKHLHSHLHLIPKAPTGGEPDGFAEWWAAYPKRDGGTQTASDAESTNERSRPAPPRRAFFVP